MEFLSKILGKDSSSAAKIALLATAVVATGTVAYYVFGGSSKVSVTEVCRVMF